MVGLTADVRVSHKLDETYTGTQKFQEVDTNFGGTHRGDTPDLHLENRMKKSG
jgi:hypothetical protein